MQKAHIVSDSESRRCNLCDRLLHISNFELNRRQCKECRKKKIDERNRELAERLRENPLPVVASKVCDSCNESKSITNFKTTNKPGCYRNRCNDCVKENTNTVSNEEIIADAQGKSKKCSVCNVMKDIVTSFSINGNTFRGQCNVCRRNIFENRNGSGNGSEE